MSDEIESLRERPAPRHRQRIVQLEKLLSWCFRQMRRNEERIAELAHRGLEQDALILFEARVAVWDGTQEALAAIETLAAGTADYHTVTITPDSAALRLNQWGQGASWMVVHPGDAVALVNSRVVILPEGSFIPPLQPTKELLP